MLAPASRKKCIKNCAQLFGADARVEPRKSTGMERHSRRFGVRKPVPNFRPKETMAKREVKTF